MGNKIYDDELVSSIISKAKSLEGTLDECCMQLKSILASDGYYGKSTTGLTNLQELLACHSEFSSFVSNAKTIYDGVYADIGESVDNIEDSNFGIIYDTLLGELGFVAQTDPKWSGFNYGKSTIGSGGCGPCSTANGLIVTFGITDPDTIKSLVLECVNMGGPGTNVTNYLIGKGKRSDKYPVLNSIIDNAGGKIYYGKNANEVKNLILENPPTNGEKVYILGKMTFRLGGSNNNSYTDFLDVVDTVYGVAPDTNITYYGVDAGKGGSPFGSRSESGHYVALLINVRDFKENNAVYLLDSFPRRLDGEDNKDTYHGDYNFVNPKYADLRTFNNTFDVTRVSDNVIKISVKNGEAFNSKNLRLLGLGRGTQVAINVNPSSTYNQTATIKTDPVDYSAKYENQLGENMPAKAAVTDTTDANAQTKAAVAASREERNTRLAADAAQTAAPETPTTAASRITGGISDIFLSKAEAEETVPEEYEFPENEPTKAKASNETPAENPGTTKEETTTPETPPTQEETPKEEKTSTQTRASNTPKSTTSEASQSAVGVVPSVSVTNGASNPQPTTSGGSTQVTVTGGANPNGHNNTTATNTPTTPTTTNTNNTTTHTTTTNTTPRYTASAGTTVSDVSYGNGPTAGETTQPVTQETTTPITTNTTTTTQETVTQPVTQEPAVTNNSNNNPAVDNTQTTSVYVGDNTTTNKEEHSTASSSESSNTGKVVGGIGLALVAAGTAALLLNGDSKDYKVKLVGDSEVSINMYENYEDKGCKVYDNDKEVDTKPNIKMNLDNTTPGTYKMVCSIENDSQTRYINVRQANDNKTVGNINIFYNDSNVLPSKYDDTTVTTKTTYTIRYNDNVDYIKYCVADYGEKCSVSSEEKHNSDTFTINETGKKVIYIEKYNNGNMVKEVRYINIK